MIRTRKIFNIVASFIIILISIQIIQSAISWLKFDRLDTTQKFIVSFVINEIQRSDRCDPLPCFDRFMFKSVEIIKEDKTVVLGGAKLTMECNSRWFIGKESNSNDGPKCVCPKGSWNIKLSAVSWFSMNPLPESLSICYR